MTDVKNIYIGKGLLQGELFSDDARLDGVQVVESDRMELLRWVMSIADRTPCYDDDKNETFMLGRVWSNHVLTVLADILHTDTDAANDLFIQNIGTPDSVVMENALRLRFDQWIRRLNGYTLGRWSMPGDHEADSSIQAACSMREFLEDALSGEDRPSLPDRKGGTLDAENPCWFRMLQAIRTIRERGGGYLRMIEAGGRMDPALALLLTFIRNYGSTVVSNAVLRNLPDFYHQEILKTHGRPAVQDNTYLVVTPAGRSVYLPEGYAFSAGENDAGEELLYSTVDSEQLTPGRITRIGSLFLGKGRTGKTLLLSNEAPLAENGEGTELFRSRGATRVRSGWQLESKLFLLSEGNRKIDVSFRLDDSAEVRTEFLDKTAFLVEASTEDGWHSCTLAEMADMGGSIRFSISIPRSAGALTPCTEDNHGTVSKYPCLRILASGDNYPKALAGAWAFHDIEIGIEVDGIRQFRLRNELGEIDPAQPFLPFGIAGERGAGFSFSHAETDWLPLKEVALNIRWDKLPQTPEGFADVYRHYGVHALTNASFLITTSYRTSEDWIACGGAPQPLFSPERGIPAEKGCIRFAFDGTLSGKDRSRTFRVMLDSPDIGFGLDEYRRLFAEVMMWNGRNHKQREIPQQPVLPRFAETSLSYRASWSDREDGGISVKLSRVAPTGGITKCRFPVEGKGYPLVEGVGAGHSLYLSFTDFRSDKRIRLYVDLDYRKKDIVVDHDYRTRENNSTPLLYWEYPCKGIWQELESTHIYRDDTQGLTRNGFIELLLPDDMDDTDPFTLRVRVDGDVSQCPALKGFYLNCIPVTAVNGDGLSIPAGTIRQPRREDARIASVFQPLPGFGGRPAESADRAARLQDERIAHRNRAVAPRDFEQLILEQFPYLEKVHCLPQSEGNGSTVRIIVFSRTEGIEYPFTPSWRIAEIERWVSTRVSPFVKVAVCNPEYRKIHIFVKAMLKCDIRDEGAVRRRLRRTIKDYFAAWMEEDRLPDLGVRYSYKELHTRIVNDPGVEKLWEIRINGTVPDIDVTDIRAENDFLMPEDGAPVWTVLIPDMYEQVFLPFSEGIDEATINGDFTIQ